MKRKITVRKVHSGNRNKPWRVTFYPPNGKRMTRHFALEDEAGIFAAEMGMEAVEPGFAVSQLERGYLEQLRCQAKRAGLDTTAVLQALVNESLKSANKVISLKQLAEAYLSDLKRIGRRPKTLDHYNRMINSFLVGQENRSIADFSSKSVMNWVRKKYINPDSQSSSKTPLMGMFRWAVENGEEWGLSDKWLINLKRNKYTATAKRRPVVFTPEEVDTLLREACPEFRPVLAIQAFAGIRPEELCCDQKTHLLSWETVDFYSRFRLENCESN